MIMRKVGESMKEDRLKFKKGLQKKFLNKIKEKSGLTWENLAKKLNICTHTLMFDWQSEKSTLPLRITKKLLEDYPFEKWDEIEKKWIQRILSKNWGQELSGGLNKKEIKIPLRSEELAELFGVILGDGHLERKTLIITGNSYEREHYNYLQNQFRKLFGLESKIYKLKNGNTIQLKINSTELIKFLIDNSFVLGNKIKNKESLPLWIFEKKEFVSGALRGLFDTDGGIYQKQKKYKRAIIEFQTKSPYIRKDLFSLIKIIELTSSKSSFNVRVQNQEEVLKFFQIVGSSNPKNIVRYNYFVKTGEIPLREKLIKDILSIKVKKPLKAALV